MWINRDPLSFQWFLELLLDLDREQAVRGSVMAKFIDIQLYQTGAKSLPSSHQPCSTCSETLLTVTPQPQPLNKITTEKADPLEPNMVTIPAESAPLVKGRCSYCTMRQMQHLLRYGRPVWDEVCFYSLCPSAVIHLTDFIKYSFIFLSYFYDRYSGKLQYAVVAE